MNVTVKLSGPLFAASPSIVLDSLHNAVEEVVLTGEREAKLMAQPDPSGLFHTRSYAAAHGYSQTGHYNRSIRGVTQSLNGTISDSGVVYGPWLELGAKGAGRFKGYSIFRKTRDKLQKDAQGILQKHVRKLVDRLS